MFFIFTVGKRCCEGYDFTRVCDSVHRGRSALGGAAPEGVLLLGGVPALGGSAPGGMPAPGVPAPGGVETPPKADGDCCGRYTSYWNAFLLQK